MGLCRGNGTNHCHDLLDALTFDRGIRYDQLMEHNVEYVVGAYNSALPAEKLRRQIQMKAPVRNNDRSQPVAVR